MELSRVRTLERVVTEPSQEMSEWKRAQKNKMQRESLLPPDV